MPDDLKVKDTEAEIQRKQELAHNLVILTGIEATYNTAIGVILALNFGLIVHFSLKAAALMRPKEEYKD